MFSTLLELVLFYFKKKEFDSLFLMVTPVRTACTLTPIPFQVSRPAVVYRIPSASPSSLHSSLRFGMVLLRYDDSDSICRYALWNLGRVRLLHMRILGACVGNITRY
jgi:hypothetical protein